MVSDAEFIQAAISRLDPAFTDSQQQYLLAPNDQETWLGKPPSDRIYRNTQQAFGCYDKMLPPRQAQPEDFIVLQYRGNGHVTLLRETTPYKASKGCVFICSISPLSEDDHLLFIHKVWNANDTGAMLVDHY
ncbi:hypothetical protein HD806DRAFT_546156 [Xylariaceae sp. AK1471]|nr:hypothetical protein HD806DRAFT_546156 [Xylariaceae sp. AK1471]